MNIYVWTRTGPVSDCYHDGGGLLVVAPNLEHARTQARDELSGLRGGGLDGAAWLVDDPDYMWPTSVGQQPQVLTFPDAGCC